MNKNLLFLSLFIPIMSLATPGEDLANQYFSQKELSLTAQEKKALSIGEKWQRGKKTSKPVAAPDGAINFVYGSGQTQIVCAVLQVCDVALQEGESINNINVGDPRFTLEPAATNTGSQQRLHLLIKPLDVGLDTSLVVTTDRRTYHFRLRSSRSDFMPYISFIYPEEAEAKWLLLKQQEKEERLANTIPETQEYLGDLDFNYSISGNARFKPTRIYNDGVKTIIEMPKAMAQNEAPILLILRNKGLFKAPEKVMVNYRLHGHRYIVDTVFDKALLIVGVGSSQEKITLVRG